jgi:hypothetical protein
MAQRQANIYKKKIEILVHFAEKRQLYVIPFTFRGPGSSVGTATRFGPDGPGIESRCEATFSAPVQTGPGAHPATCTVSTKSTPGVESGRGLMLTPHPLLVPRSKNSTAIPLLYLRAFVACENGVTYLPLTFISSLYNHYQPIDVLSVVICVQILYYEYCGGTQCGP